MKASVIASLACAVALVTAGPLARQASAQTTTTTTASSSDRALDKRITHRFHNDASLKHYDVKVSVDKKVAVLTGAVATNAQRRRAERLAKASGAARVDNQIVVDAAVATSGKAESVGRKTDEGIERGKEGAEKAWEKTKDGTARAGAEVSDGWISTTIKTKFMGNEGTRASTIDVDTDHHVVTLTGTAVSEAARAKAVELARATTGVTKVVDRLRVRE